MTFYKPTLSKRTPGRSDPDPEEAAESEERDADPDEVDAAQDRYESTLGWKRDQA